ncbi:4a-hydroxytetrahydrobiopterin dehydratase family protein [Nonomuraea wenchangensis]|uniref:Cell division protein FtsB n=1 Tax=Nonomuraea wenchangensis TaxID=568860 RepID=A0A1H9ZHL0_9ACTN|nr:hypothetical protein [Nonomuraea wenchangensis]SES81044.1 hypothetical protein SAMN05421811_101410 [Nonomuraea wenchangensis]
MTTEQETGRVAAVRRAAPAAASKVGSKSGSKTGAKTVPRTGVRRSPAPHQSKPHPPEPQQPKARARTEARPEPRTEARTGTRTEARPGTRTSARPEAASRPARPAAARRPARRQRTPFVLLVVGLMSGGLVSLLLLNTMLAQDAITDAKLREQIAVARQEKEKIEQDYQRKTQPGVIAELAEQQGQHPDWDNVNSWNGDQAPQADTQR